MSSQPNAKAHTMVTDLKGAAPKQKAPAIARAKLVLSLA